MGRKRGTGGRSEQRRSSRSRREDTSPSSSESRSIGEAQELQLWYSDTTAADVSLVRLTVSSSETGMAGGGGVEGNESSVTALAMVKSQD